LIDSINFSSTHLGVEDMRIDVVRLKLPTPQGNIVLKKILTYIVKNQAIKATVILESNITTPSKQRVQL